MLFGLESLRPAWSSSSSSFYRWEWLVGCSARPVASDMREVVSSMKVSTNLERVADQSVTIARRAKHLNNRPAVRELALLEPGVRASS